eukprot:c28388_g3_i1 orf=13-171(-)
MKISYAPSIYQIINPISFKVNFQVEIVKYTIEKNCNRLVLCDWSILIWFLQN